MRQAGSYSIITIFKKVSRLSVRLLNQPHRLYLMLKSQLLFFNVIKMFGYSRFTSCQQAIFRQTWGCVHEPVGLLFVHDSEPGMWELVSSNPRCSCWGCRVTLEPWKPCLPEPPVFRLWLGGWFRSATWNKPVRSEVNVLVWMLAWREIKTRWLTLVELNGYCLQFGIFILCQLASHSFEWTMPICIMINEKISQKTIMLMYLLY